MTHDFRGPYTPNTQKIPYDDDIQVENLTRDFTVTPFRPNKYVPRSLK